DSLSASSMILSAVFFPTQENSSTRNRNSVRLAVLFNIWISRPSSMPYGWGLISVGRVGSVLVLRAKRTSSPCGSWGGGGRWGWGVGRLFRDKHHNRGAALP